MDICLGLVCLCYGGCSIDRSKNGTSFVWIFCLMQFLWKIGLVLQLICILRESCRGHRCFWVCTGLFLLEFLIAQHTLRILPKSLHQLDILSCELKFRPWNKISTLNAPLEIEYEWFKPAIKKSLLDLHKSSYRQCVKCPADMTLYGHIIFGQKKGCSHFYKLLNFSIKHINLWKSAAISLDNSWDEAGLQHNILN